VTPADNVISTRDLRKGFAAKGGRVEAVRGVSIDVAHGEIFGFLGPNGAGKTTTLRMLTTLLPIDSGTATVAGYDVAARPKQVRERIGYVSQLGGADELATGRENLLLQGRLYGATKAQAEPRAEELAELLDLADFADRRVATYSGGQRRRLDIALGIMHQPSVLFLDEPTTGLDPQSRANLWDHIRALGERGTTVFLTTHYLDEADELCDRLMIMDHGQIVAEGTPRALKQQVAGDAIVITLRAADHDTAPDTTHPDTHPASPAAGKAAPLLRAEPYVRELTAEDGQVRLYVDDGGTALPQLIRLLDSNGIAIRSISMSEPTLDDVFLRQTGRSLRDETAGEETAGGAAGAAGDAIAPADAQDRTPPGRPRHRGPAGSDGRARRLRTRGVGGAGGLVTARRAPGRHRGRRPREQAGPQGPGGTKTLLDIGLLFARCARQLLRNPIWVIMGFSTPILYLALFTPLLRQLAGTGILPGANVLNYFLPGILSLLAFASGLGPGFSVLFEFKAGVIERFRVTPASRLAILLGPILATLAMMFAFDAVLVAVGAGFGFSWHGAGLLVLAVLLGLLMIVMATFSVATALATKDITSFASIVSGINLPVILLAGVLLPISLGPAWMRTLAHFNPLFYLVQASRVLAGGTLTGPAVWQAFAVLVPLCVAVLAWATSVFRRAVG
jgi:ABC-2 type transport system ATP-binding protein